MSNKAKAELEIATNVRDIVRQIEQGFASLSQKRMLELDLGPALKQLQEFSRNVDKLGTRIEKAMAPLEQARSSKVGSLNNFSNDLRNRVIPKMMQSEAANTLRQQGMAESQVLRSMIKEYRKAIALPDLKREADETNEHVKKTFLSLLTSLGYSEKAVARVAGEFNGMREDVAGLDKELNVLNTHLKTTATNSSKLSKTMDTVIRDQERVIDATISGTTKVAVAQSKALAESTRNYKAQITQMTNAVKSDFRQYNESSVQGLLVQMRREYDDMKRIRDQMATHGQLNSAQAANFQRNLLTRQQMIEGFSGSAVPGMQKRVMDQQFANDRRIQQLGVWRKVNNAETASTLVERTPSRQNLSKLNNQVRSLQNLSNNLSAQRALYETGDKKAGISKDLGYAQMLQILESNVNSKLNAYRTQSDAARVAMAKRGINQTASALDPSQSIDFSNVAYSRARNLRAQQARIEEVRNAIERVQKSKTQAGGLTGTFQSQIGGLDSLIAQGEGRLGHKNVSAAEVEELNRTLTDMRRLRERYYTDLAAFTQRDLEIQRAADREAVRSAATRLAEFKRMNQTARQDEARQYVQGLLANPNAINKLGKEDITYARAMVQQAHHMYRQGMPNVPDEQQMAGIRVALDDRMKNVRQPSMGQRMAAAFGFNGGGAYGRENDSVLHHINKRVTNAAQMMGTSLYGMGIFGLGSAIAGGTIGQAAQKETLTNTLAGLINSYAKFTDVTGTAVTSQENFQQALTYSGKVYDMLREKAVKSILTTHEMFDSFMSGAPQLMARGMNIQQSLKIVDAIASLGKAMGLSNTAVQSDVRDLATGQVTVRSQVLRTMGMNANDLRQARMQGPTALSAYFDKIISGVKPALDRLEETTTSKLSKFLDTAQQIGIKFGETMAPILMPYLEKFEKSIMGWVQSGNAEKFAKSFAGMLGTMFNALDWFVNAAAPLVSSIDNIILGGIMVILTKTAAQALLASADFKAAMASFLPTIIEISKMTPSARGGGMTTEAGQLISAGVAQTIANGGVKGRLASAFPTFASMGSNAKQAFAGMGTAIATQGFFGSIGNVFKSGLAGITTMVATAGRGLLAVITGTVGMLMLALTAAVASIMLLKKVVDNDRENVDYLGNMDDKATDALNGKGMTPEQVLAARRRVYSRSFDVNDPRALKAMLKNPNLDIRQSLDEAMKTTSDNMQKHGASWNPDGAKQPFEEALKNARENQVDPVELMGFVRRTVGAMPEFRGRAFSNDELLNLVGNNAGVRKQLENRRQSIMKDKDFDTKLAGGNPIFGGMDDPEMQKRLADIHHSISNNKLETQLVNLERASERAARQIATMADSAMKGGVYLKARAISDKAGSDAAAAVLKFRMEESKAVGTMNSTADNITTADRLNAAGDLVKAQAEQAKTMQQISDAYNDQLRQTRDNILAQKDEIAARKESIRVSGLQIEADRRKMELSRLDYGKTGNLSGYINSFNQSFNADMMASNAGFYGDVAKNKREADAIRRAGDSDAKVRAFFGNSIKDQGFGPAKLLQQSVDSISRVYVAASDVIAATGKAQVSATGQAIDTQTKLIDSNTGLKGAIEENTKAVQTQTATAAATGTNAYPQSPDRKSLEDQRASDAKKLHELEQQKIPSVEDRIMQRLRQRVPNYDKESIGYKDRLHQTAVEQWTDEFQSDYNHDVSQRDARIKLFKNKIASADKSLSQPDQSVGQRITAITQEAAMKHMVYTWGATVAQFTQGAADCSSFISVLGANIGMLSKGTRETAQGLYNMSSPVKVARAGDLVFSSGTHKGAKITHVGMVVDADHVAQMGSSGARILSMKAFQSIGKYEGVRRLARSPFIGQDGVPAVSPFHVDTSVIDSSKRAIDQLALQQKQLELWQRVTERVGELNQKFGELLTMSTQLAGAFENSITQIQEAQRSMISSGLASTGPNGNFGLRLGAAQLRQQAFLTGNSAEYLDPAIASFMGISGAGSKFGGLKYDSKTGRYSFNGEGSYTQKMSAVETLRGDALMLRNALIGNNGQVNPEQLELVRRNYLQKMLDQNPGAIPENVAKYMSANGKTFSQVMQATRSGDASQMGLIPKDVQDSINKMFQPYTQEMLKGIMNQSVELASTLSGSAHDTANRMAIAIDLLQTNASVFNERFSETFQRMSSQINKESDLIGLYGYDYNEAKARNAADTQIELITQQLQKKQEGAFNAADKLGMFKPLDNAMQLIGGIVGDDKTSADQKLLKAKGLTDSTIMPIIMSLPADQQSMLKDMWNQATSDTTDLGTDLIGFFNTLREKFMDAIVKGLSAEDADKLKKAIRERKQLEVDQRQAQAIREAEAQHASIVMNNNYNRAQGLADQAFQDYTGGGSIFSPIGGASPMERYNRSYELDRADIDRGADEAVAQERTRLRRNKLEALTLQFDPNYYDRFRQNYVSSRMDTLRTKYSATLPRTRTLQAFDQVAQNFGQSVMTDPFAYISGRKNFGDEVGNILSPLTSGHQNLISDATKGLFATMGSSTSSLMKMFPQAAFPQFYNKSGVFQRGAAMKQFGQTMIGNFLGNVGGNMIGTALFPHKDPAAIGMGASLGTAAGGFLAAAGTGIFGSMGLMHLGAAAGPVGMIVGGVLGGLIGGLFGGRKVDPEEERQRQLQLQHQQRLEELLSRIDRSLRPMPDYFRTLRNDVLYGSASGWYSGRAYASLGRQANVGGR